ncbi:hypothetical protein HN592_01330 [Candidatus Woesearchaeota archaeon]|jgi:hypothetical protein|nr:hypothetical protein [Candidatus Woesearchaeota archaeon]MBT4368653.1 hypothetical protein [Candidatus Woesearchaeota archaeon]MBT4712208.1 hypothetical protein [Candidatus Woesearchaeota archaeon]MBT6638960.1 hypothetical protein [Candidatus Woesearchaeota archaeon]MBT7134138.1 hypothetical protein [Candidatus Woesearchaeota archaeon]
MNDLDDELPGRPVFSQYNILTPVHVFEGRVQKPDYGFHLSIYYATCYCTFANVIPLMVCLDEVAGQTKFLDWYSFCDNGELIAHRGGEAEVNKQVMLGNADTDLSSLVARLKTVQELLELGGVNSYLRTHEAIKRIRTGSF